MRFLGRALTGLFLACLTVGLIGLGAWRLYEAGEQSGARRSSPVQERQYNVDVATLRPETVTPVITAFGQVRAWRMLEVRSAEDGPIIEISPNFRDGAIIAANELLFRVDPADYQRRVKDAEVALAQSVAELNEAREAVPIAIDEVKNAQRQLALKQSDLKRKSRLKGKGFVAATAYDDARHAVNTAEQTLNTKRRSRLAATKALRTGELAVERARITLADAQKALRDTSYRAPFSGPLTDVVATLGKRVSKNEKLGVLIDPASLEVSFRISEEEFGRLLTDGRAGTLEKLRVTAQLDLGARRVTLEGVLDRAASVTDLTTGGRTVFARIEADVGLQIRPGDFVTVKVFEPPLTGVVSIPAIASTDEGQILLLSKDDRIEVHKAKVLRRQMDSIVVADVPFGREYITARQPFLAAGIKVKPLRAGAAPAPTHMVLSKERRETLKRLIASRKRMPKFVKERLLKTLDKPRVPIALVQRLESRMAAGAPPGQNGATVTLSDEKRGALRKYVKEHPIMPEPVKERLLGRLDEPKVPAAMVKRLEAGMNGQGRP